MDVNLRHPAWDRAAWILILAHTVLLLAWWPLLPFFLDSYYHLNVVHAFHDAGGVVLHDFWEFAPLGRPHLYPPALHVLLLSVDALHLPPLTLARLLTVVTYPALLGATWWFMRTWCGSIPAYWTTLCGVIPFSYLLVACNTVAASWAVVLWLIGLVALCRGAFLAFVLCGTLAFYTHLGIPWLMVCSWVLMGICHAPSRRLLILGVALTLVLSLPWLLHLWTYRGFFGPMSSLENDQLELPILLYLFALLGLKDLFAHRPLSSRWVLVAVWTSLLLMIPDYRFRFFSGQGVLGISLLGGVGLTSLYAWAQTSWTKRVSSASWLVPVGLTVLAIVWNPTLFLQEGHPSVVIGDSSVSNLTPWGEHLKRSHASSFYYPHLIDPVVQIIGRHSGVDELIGCNLPYTCGLFAALSHRSMATGMFAEVHAAEERPVDALRHAQLIIWLKSESMPGMPPLPVLQQRWQLALVGETDMAYVFRNPHATALRQVAKPILPLWQGQLLVWIMIGLIGWDLHRHRET